MNETFTDCRSEEGITVGLLDSIIAVARVVANRPLQTEAVQQALADLRNDEDVAFLLQSEQ